MSVSSLGDKGEPQFESSGNAPTFAADLTAVSDYAAKVGNRIVGTTAEREAFTPWEGLEWYDTTLELPMYYDGTDWVWSLGVPYAEAAGEAATTGASGGSSSPFYWSGNESVSFPVGRFSVAPLVTATPAGNVSGSIFPGVQIHDITTSGFTFKVFRIGAAPATGTKIHWRAVQMTSAAAAG